MKGSVDLIIVLFSAESSGENPEKVYPAERERSSGAERGCGVSWGEFGEEEKFESQFGLSSSAEAFIVSLKALCDCMCV